MDNKNIIELLNDIDDCYILEADENFKYNNHRRLKNVIITIFLCTISIICVMTILFNDNNNNNNVVNAEELGMEEYTFGAIMPTVIYADDTRIVLFDHRGIYVYDMSLTKLVGFGDFRTIDMTAVQGDNPTFVESSKNGEYIRFYNNKSKYIYFVNENKISKLDTYEEYQDEVFEIREIYPGEDGSISNDFITYLVENGDCYSIKFEESIDGILRYKNLQIIKNAGDETIAYEIFK